jgi:cell division cycle protein 20 (cofactor of APC complex)
MITPRLRFREHTGAIKALDWCPYSSTGTIASGGGQEDATIKVWDTNNGNVLSSTFTGSQVCSVLWSQNYHQRGELLSAHQTGELHLWRYGKRETTTSGSYLTHSCELDGHRRRILNLVMSPNGGIVASVGGDERLKLWDVFGGRDDRSTSIRRSFLSQNDILPGLGMKTIR